MKNNPNIEFLARHLNKPSREVELLWRQAKQHRRIEGKTEDYLEAWRVLGDLINLPLSLPITFLGDAFDIISCGPLSTTIHRDGFHCTIPSCTLLLPSSATST